MLRKIFITFFACLIVYSFFIFALSRRGKEFHGAQNMWQENVIRMQDYIYTTKNYEEILLGSSLTTHVLVDNNDPKIFNLAAGGGDPFIGLEIIKRSNKNPKKIYIESNFLLTKKVHDETYLNTLYLPVFYTLREFMPIFKEKYQPVSIVGSGFSRLYNMMFENRDSKHNTGMMDDKVDKNIVKLRIQQAKYYSSKFSDDKLIVEKNAQILQEYIDFYKKKGVSLSFFEMPRDCELMRDSLTVYSRAIVTEIAKKNHLTEIPLPDCKEYSTSDGLHLTQPSSIKYTRFFFSELGRTKAKF